MQREYKSNELLELVYDELRAVAERYFRRQPPGFTLCPTDIVHEAFLHLDQGHAAWTSTGHFRAIAICKMWQVVIDHLKRRQAQKRNGSPPPRKSDNPTISGDGPLQLTHGRKREPLDNVSVEWHDRDVDLLDLADALAELGQESSRLRDVVTLHWFGRMTHAEVAEELGVSASTAEKDFRYALAWLNRRLQSESHGN